MSMLIRLMAAMGSGIPYREFVSLQGTSGSPISQTFLGEPAGQLSNIVFNFSADASAPASIEKGYVQYAGYEDNVQASYVNIGPWVEPLTGWTADYWIRATNEGDGVSNTQLDPTYPQSNSLDTWHALTEDSVNIYWGWQHDGPQIRGGTIKVEIADDAVGTTILATGYYRGTVSAEN